MFNVDNIKSADAVIADKLAQDKEQKLRESEIKDVASLSKTIKELTARLEILEGA